MFKRIRLSYGLHLFCKYVSRFKTSLFYLSMKIAKIILKEIFPACIKKACLYVYCAQYALPELYMLHGRFNGGLDGRRTPTRGMSKAMQRDV